jgi:hypothetical protein
MFYHEGLEERMAFLGLAFSMWISGNHRKPNAPALAASGAS